MLLSRRLCLRSEVVLIYDPLAAGLSLELLPGSRGLYLLLLKITAKVTLLRGQLIA